MDDIMLNYLLLFGSIIVVLVAQIAVSSAYARYKRVKNSKGLTGFDVAKEILESNGMSDVYVTETQGNLSDHYDPRRKVVRLLLLLVLLLMKLVMLFKIKRVIFL